MNSDAIFASTHGFCTFHAFESSCHVTSDVHLLTRCFFPLKVSPDKTVVSVGGGPDYVAYMLKTYFVTGAYI